MGHSEGSRRLHKVCNFFVGSCYECVILHVDKEGLRRFASPPPQSIF